MSIRSVAVVATAAAALAVPTAASARPPEQVDVGSVGVPVVQTAEPSVSPTTSTTDHGAGLGTLTVLVLAGGTLVVGAAGGFGGSRALTRRQALRP